MKLFVGLAITAILISVVCVTPCDAGFLKKVLPSINLEAKFPDASTAEATGALKSLMQPIEQRLASLLERNEQAEELTSTMSRLAARIDSYEAKLEGIGDRLDATARLHESELNGMRHAMSAEKEMVARIESRLDAANEIMGNRITSVRDAMTAIDFPTTQCELCMIVTGRGSQCSVGTFCTKLGKRLDPHSLIHIDTNDKKGGCYLDLELNCWQE